MDFPKERFPFRVGTTSYIVEDGLIGNLRFLSDKVDEVQLVLFDSGGYSNLPTPRQTRELRQIAAGAGLSVSVHLPGDIELGHSDPAIRRASRELFKRAVDATAALRPIGWVLHIIPSKEFTLEKEIDHERLARHSERASESLSALMPLFDSPREVCIENIHRHFAIEPPFIKAFGTSVCIDVGHLLNYGMDVEGHLDTWGPLCRLMHLHGTNEKGEDHASLAHLPEGFLASLFERLQRGPSPESVTMEVFGRKDFISSAAALSSLRPPPIAPRGHKA